MFNLDPSKLFVIAVVIVIVLGPERLPHFARQLGSVWRAFSEFRQRMESEVRDSLPDLPSTTDLATYARSPSALLNHLSSTTSADSSTGSADGSVPDSLGAMGDLPAIARGDHAHWTAISSERPTASNDGPRANEASGTDAEKVWLEAQAPFAGDATLN